MVKAKMGNRRDEIIEAGLELFAKLGYYSTTTALIAERAGISQPYVFKFFRTKEDLFVTALDRAYERILRAFRNVQAGPSQLVDAMIDAYERLSDVYPNEVALQVVGLAVPEEPIKAAARQGLRKIKNAVLKQFQSAGIENAEYEVSTFLARGILCNISFFLDLPELMDKA